MGGRILHSGIVKSSTGPKQKKDYGTLPRPTLSTDIFVTGRRVSVYVLVEF